MKTLIPAMVLAALTKQQSDIVLACLVFVTVLLIIGTVKMLRRVRDLETVVYSGDEITQEAHDLVAEIQDSANSKAV